MTRRQRLALAGVLLLCARPASGQDRVLGLGGGAWLDGPPTNWNTPAMRVPRAESAALPPDTYRKCASTIRVARDGIDRLLTAQGWTLVDVRRNAGSVTIATATAGLDERCRPLGLQGFVFVGTVLVGTLMPAPVSGGTDGFPTQIAILPGGQIAVGFARYRGDEPVATPRATSVVRYVIERIGGRPVLRPGAAVTTEEKRP